MNTWTWRPCCRACAAPLVATALDGASDLYRTALPARCAWVFGHEGQGVDAGRLLAAAA